MTFFKYVGRLGGGGGGGGLTTGQAQQLITGTNAYRNDAIENVEPTAAEHPNPTAGDTVIVWLNDGRREIWTHDGATYTRESILASGVGEVVSPAANQAAMLALADSVGQHAVRSDTNTVFIQTASPATNIANWAELASGLPFDPNVADETAMLAKGDTVGQEIFRTDTNSVWKQILSPGTNASDWEEMAGSGLDIYDEINVTNATGTSVTAAKVAGSDTTYALSITAGTFNIPVDAGLPVGSEIRLHNIGGGDVGFTLGGAEVYRFNGVAVDNNPVANGNGDLLLRKIDATNWDLIEANQSGAGVTAFVGLTDTEATLARNEKQIANGTGSALVGSYSAIEVDSLATLLADNDVEFSRAGDKALVAGDKIVTALEGFRFEVAAAAPGDEHNVTAGGLELYARPSEGKLFRRQFNDPRVFFNEAMTTGNIAVVDQSETINAFVTLETNAPLSIEGLPGKTITFGGAVSNVFRIGSDFDCKNLSFSGGLRVFYNSNTDTVSAGDIFIDNCKFNACQLPIDLERPFASLNVTGNRFEDCLFYMVRVGWNDFASQEGWEYVNISDNIAVNITQSGASDAGFCITYGKKVVVQGNHVFGVDGAGAADAYGIYIKSRESIVSDNTIENVQGGSVTTAPINVKGENRSGNGSPQGYGCIVHGNHIKCNQLAPGIRAFSDDVIVIDNIIDDPITAGVFLEAGPHSRCIARGNKIYGTGVAGTYGIRQVSSGRGSEAVENEIHNTEFGILITRDATATNDLCKTNSNTFRDVDYPILFNPATVIQRQVICDNVSHFSAAATGRTARAFATFSNKATELIFKGNEVSGHADAEIDWGASGWSSRIDLEHTYSAQTAGTTILPLFSETIEDGQVVAMDVRAVANQDDASNRAMYHKVGLFEKTAGAVNTEGAITDVYQIESNAAWNLDLTPAAGNIRLRLLGAGVNVNWTVHLKMDVR